MNKRIKPNRYKPEAVQGRTRPSDSGSGIDFCINAILTVAFVCILSLASIFVYDFVTQSAYFNIKNVEISGTRRVLEKDILDVADLSKNKNIFSINLCAIEQRIASHPWIQSAKVKRKMSNVLCISIVEQQPLAIVKIENLTDILINTQGSPFKEYNPQQDRIENLPVISGLDLTQSNNQYLFNGPLFNSIMDFLKTDHTITVRTIDGDQNTGVEIEADDIYNRTAVPEQQTIPIKLGFRDFKAKLNKAKIISTYMAQNFPDKTICAMDLCNIKKIFVKTRCADTLHITLEKGV